MNNIKLFKFQINYLIELLEISIHQHLEYPNSDSTELIKMYRSILRRVEVDNE